jgi:aspartyl-tRNA(Asn)/glutamyl-tRNA(Gln) amidotransferase subunit C
LIDLKTLESIAAYAKLRMEDGDLDEISAALDMMDRINEIPLDRDEFPTGGGTSAVLREDTARPSMPRGELLRNAPQVEAGCISVPKILGGDSQ